MGTISKPKIGWYKSDAYPLLGWLYRPYASVWNLASITPEGYLELWDFNNNKWVRVDTPPGATIDELKALAVALIRMGG